ncbi:MAG: hypothetical protein ACYTHN_15910 [Planctomycetota bacterium]
MIQQSDRNLLILCIVLLIVIFTPSLLLPVIERRPEMEINPFLHEVSDWDEEWEEPGKTFLSHLWLAPGVGIVKWRTGTGETYLLADYSIPSSKE